MEADPEVLLLLPMVEAVGMAEPLVEVADGGNQLSFRALGQVAWLIRSLCFLS